MDQIKTIFAARIKVARLFFMISALYGLILRLYAVVDFIPVAYKNILQSHSHVTFLGWGFLAVVTIIGFVFYPKILSESRYSKVLFNIMTSTLVGMLISFPLQGYKVFSITFLSVFLITSYLYLFQVLKNLKQNTALSVKFIRTGIYYYLLSSLAIWTIAVITTKLGKTDLYYNTVYFYLHFLYNGFFAFVLFGLLIHYLEKKHISIPNKAVLKFYWLTNIALVPAYFLSVLWIEVPTYIYYIGFIAAVLQVVSLVYLFKIAGFLLQTLSSRHLKSITYFVLTAYFLKIIFQFFSVFPSIMKIAIQYKHYFVIGYLHLFTLGFLSLAIILLLKLHFKKPLSSLGVNTLMVGIFLSEFLLFLQGAAVYFFDSGIPKIKWLLFWVSVLMPLGIIIIHLKLYFKTVSKKKHIN